MPLGRKGGGRRASGGVSCGIILKLRARRRAPVFRQSSNTPITVSGSRGPWLAENTGAVRLMHTEKPCANLAREARSEEHTSELQSHLNLVCRLLLEKKNKRDISLMCNPATCLSLCT